jgi:hypothetical protein
MLSQSGILKTSDLTPIAPVVSVEASGADTLVKFGTLNGKKYSVEVSTDNQKFSQFATVEGTGSEASVPTGSAVSSTAKFYRVIAF